jgi:transposase-like protein
MERTDLEAAVAEGMSIAQLATRFECSKATARYWLRKYGLRTRYRSKMYSSPDAIAARDAGITSFVGSCTKHGRTEFVRERSGYFRCGRCRAEAVTARRRRVKEVLVLEAGGRCQICGYDRYAGALQFHHLDRSEKSFTFGRRGMAMSIELSREEARKCVLLCANCHAEVEGGITSVSLH